MHTVQSPQTVFKSHIEALGKLGAPVRVVKLLDNFPGLLNLYPSRTQHSTLGMNHTACLWQEV